MSARVVLATLLAWLGAACAADAGGEVVASASSRTIYGADTRVEIFETPSEGLRSVARRSTLAVLRRSSLDGTDPADVRIVAPSLREARGLCADAPFAEQPSAAVCSAVLLDDDLAVTAAHCFEDEGSCGDLVLVSGYAYDAPGRVGIVRAADVFACRRVAYPGGPGAPDVAVIQLDRRVPSPLAPAVTAVRAPAAASIVAAVGHGEGLPAKIDPDGRWLGPSVICAACARVAVDAFSGASGQGIFDASHALAGVLVAGQRDYAVSARGCLEARAASGPDPGELIVEAGAIVRALCTEGWPSERLCGRRGACGDGVCALVEDTASCPGDCPTAACGDGRCEGDEWRTCSLDCAEPASVTHGEAPVTAGGDGPAITAGEGCSVTAARTGGPAPALIVVALAALRRRRRAGDCAALKKAPCEGYVHRRALTGRPRVCRQLERTAAKL